MSKFVYVIYIRTTAGDAVGCPDEPRVHPLLLVRHLARMRLGSRGRRGG